MKKFARILSFALVAVMLCATLVACGAPAKDPDDALAALKENGYTAVKDTVASPLALKALGVKNVTSVVSGTKVVDDKVENITIVYFEDKDAAKDSFEKLEEYAEDEKDEDATWVVKQSGAMIYFGTEQAIKDAK